MRISNGTRIGDIGEHNGYGYATVKMLQSLARLGYEVNTNDPTADVEIWFDQPQYWKFSPGVYKIGYHPWESTQLLPKGRMTHDTDWLEIMNECDEIWTPSPIIADWYVRYMGITPPVYVYEHGVDPEWTTVNRVASEPFSFLHVGAEANRKGAREVMQAYREGFFDERHSGKVVLNMKMINEGWQIGALPGINIINELHDFEQLVKLFHDNHVFVYPSWGEGFGLNPIQALATGMPTIIPPAWAPYAKYIHPELAIPSRMQRSPWQQLHPGNMFEPDQKALKSIMRYARNNYDELVDWHVAQVPALREEYSWDRITKQVFTDLENRLGK